MTKRNNYSAAFKASESSSKLSTVWVGAMPQGSKTAAGERFTQIARIPKDTAPITSKGLPEISQLLRRCWSSVVKQRATNNPKHLQGW